MKKLILFILLLVIGFIAWYGYHEFSRRNKDLKSAQAAMIVDAPSLITAFEKDSSSANKKYTDKVIAVTGNVKKIDKDGNPVIIFLGPEGQMSSVKCSMDSTHAADYNTIKPGTNVKIKGRCTGGQTEDLFGTDVTLNYCVIEGNK